LILLLWLVAVVILLFFWPPWVYHCHGGHHFVSVRFCQGWLCWCGVVCGGWFEIWKKLQCLTGLWVRLINFHVARGAGVEIDVGGSVSLVPGISPLDADESGDGDDFYNFSAIINPNGNTAPNFL
jgi:hypothetical protein